MKAYDIIGFTAVGVAGYMVGRDMATGPGVWSAFDVIIIALLIGIGFFFAVVLS